ncbi:phosphotransferase, partial [Acinetobacter baumannii]|nr:phosphotransferase [Acinetobacter baumannii]
TGETMTVSVPWSGRLGLTPAPSGIYRVRLHATVRGDPHEAIEQDWAIAVGAPPTPTMPAFAPLARPFAPAAVPAPGALPYTVYLG